MAIVYLYEFANNSNYHGLLASVQHRLSHGINITASYTYSKALDASDSYSSAVDPFLDPRSRNYGPAGFDRRQVFTTNFYYKLPKPGLKLGIRPMGWITDNWELSGVARMLTGAPITPGYSLITGINTPTGTRFRRRQDASDQSHCSARATLRPSARAGRTGQPGQCSLVGRQHRSAVR